MKRLLLTHSKFSLQKILLAFSTFLILLCSGAKINAQCGALTGLSSTSLNVVCQGTVGNYFINNYNGASIYTFGALPFTTIVASGPNVTINWSSPGNYVLTMTDNTAGPCPNTVFQIHVVPSAAPQLNCNDTVNVSLDQTCNAVIWPGKIGRAHV